MNKPTAYDMDTRTDRISLYMGTDTPTEAPLSAADKALLKILSEVDPDSVTGAGIIATIEGGDTRKQRQMIRDLKSQISDGPEVMFSILGEKAFDALVTQVV